MKLTPELIQNSHSGLNPLKERQLNLRGEPKFCLMGVISHHLLLIGNQIPAIENLGVTKVWIFTNFLGNRNRWTFSTQRLVRTTRLLSANLRIPQDQHDAMDFTDNSVTTLANFPLMRRLRSLHLANNHIVSISPSLHLSLPNLTTLMLTNNSLAQLGDLEPLKDCRALQFLSLLGNPVREKKYYRDWVVWRCKALRVLDFTRIREKVCRCQTFQVPFEP